jgi:putative membrane protein
MKQFARDENTHTPRFYRILNEAPVLIIFAVVCLAILKPF